MGLRLLAPGLALTVGYLSACNRQDECLSTAPFDASAFERVPSADAALFSLAAEDENRPFVSIHAHQVSRNSSRLVAAEFVTEPKLTNLSLHLREVAGRFVVDCVQPDCEFVIETFRLGLGDFTYRSNDGRTHLVTALEVTVVAPSFASGDQLTEDLVVHARGSLDGQTFTLGHAFAEHSRKASARISLATVSYIRVDGQVHFDIVMPDGVTDARGCTGTTVSVAADLRAPWVEAAP